jgi:hypothetical protein
MPKSYEREIGGRPLTIEVGKLAGQANGAATVRYGDTVVLVTACVSSQLREGVDFLTAPFVPSSPRAFATTSRSLSPCCRLIRRTILTSWP